MFSNLKGKMKSWNSEKRHKNEEKKLVSAFHDYEKAIMQDFQVFDQSPQLLNAARH